MLEVKSVIQLRGQYHKYMTTLTLFDATNNQMKMTESQWENKGEMQRKTVEAI